jgi:signal transduction histidine kinase
MGWTALPFWIYRTNPMTAASLVLSGFVLLLPRATGASMRAYLKRAVGWILCAVGAAKLVRLMIGQQRGVDLLLFPETVQSFNENVLMAPSSALALVLLGGALVLSTRRFPQAPIVAQLLSAAALAVSTAGLIAYAYGAISGNDFTNASAMALQTGVALAGVSIGVLWTRPRRGLTGIITDPTFGGVLARRLLPIVVLTTVGLGALRVGMARLGMFDELTRTALLVTAILITLVVVVLIFARNLGRLSLQLARREQALREALMKLTHANRITTMGQLTASIAHEITQPIAATVTNAEAGLNWLNARPPNLEKVKEMLGCIASDGMRAGDVIDRIRDLIKKAPPRKEALQVNALVLEVVAVTRSEMVKNGILLRTQLAENLPLVQGDHVQLQQVMLNLIMNAVEAMMDLDAGPRELLISTGQNASGDVLVSVRDSGPGRDPRIADRLFEPFYTTKSGGMGMGLAISRSIVEDHGGRMWSDANEGRGAVFHFTVPLEATASATQPGWLQAGAMANFGSEASQPQRTFDGLR